MTEETEMKETRSKKEKKAKPILTEQELQKRKSRKTKVAVASFVLILALGIMGNWYYQNTDLSAQIQPLINSAKTKTLGEAEYVGATVPDSSSEENEYFSSARVDRQKARDEALDALQKIINSAEENSEAKAKAVDDAALLSKNIEIENKIESLVCAKGIDNCLAVVSADGKRVDVIVECEDLSDQVIIQVKDIATKQLGCEFKDVTIIQSK